MLRVPHLWPIGVLRVGLHVLLIKPQRILIIKEMQIKTTVRYHLIPSKRAAAAAKSLESCPTLCDPIDGSPPGSPIPGILQARTLEWVAISFSNNLPAAAAKSLQLCPTLLLLEKQISIWPGCGEITTLYCIVWLRMWNGTHAMENSTVIPQKTKNNITEQSSKCFSEYIPKGT